MTDHRTAVWEIPAIAVAPVLAAVIGSAFNIWYNGTQIEPLLNESQWQLFQKSVRDLQRGCVSRADRNLAVASAVAAAGAEVVKRRARHHGD